MWRVLVRCCRPVGASLLHLVVMAALIGVVLAMLPASAQAQSQPTASVPADAGRHKLTLRREAQQAWGLQAPVATFAAQVHQESRWRMTARSPVGALGLAQVMPGTAGWLAQSQPSLTATDPTAAPLNPTWALRALVVYDKWLWTRIKAASPCERMAFTLAAYNGGLGWVQKRQQVSAQPGVCLGHTCRINPGIKPAAQAENQAYPERILQQLEPLYAAWGPRSCQA